MEGEMVESNRPDYGGEGFGTQRKMLPTMENTR